MKREKSFNWFVYLVSGNFSLIVSLAVNMKTATRGGAQLLF